MAWNSDMELHPGVSQGRRKIWRGHCDVQWGYFLVDVFLEELWGSAQGCRRDVWKGGICSGPPECHQCLWQPDTRSSYTSKHELECPACSTFDDLIHNPKRGIIGNIGSCFPCTAPCSQVLDPFAFISSRGIFHLPFYDLFSQ